MHDRAERLFRQYRDDSNRRTDLIFAVFFLFEYFAMIAAALIISPKLMNVGAAVVLGGLTIVGPICLALFYSGRTVTRHVIAVAQIAISALMIHFMGGRIETHFHIFGSLAFLSFYRDWRVLVSASLIVAVDHLFRGFFWPQAAYQTASGDSIRWLEYLGWVAFETVFLILGCHQSIRSMKAMAERQAELEQAQEVRDSFLSICSHELKTPLTSLRLQTELGQRTLVRGLEKGDLAGKFREYVQSTDKQVERLNRLVEDMLDVSQIHLGRLSIRAENVDLGALSHEVIARCSPQLDSSGCKALIEAERDVVGHWDRYRIEQVLVNLVVNAAKYGAGKPVSVAVSRDADKSVARVVVQDRGIGIARADHHRIFQRFERVTSHHQKKTPGIGLGLYIARNIVEQHGGSIQLQSEIGEGAKFIVELPLEV